MMATKPTTSLRDRRHPAASSPLHHSSSASRSARPSPKTPLSGEVNKSPLAAKKPVPNYLKPKNADPPIWRISTMTTTTTTSATSKTPSARRSAEKAQSALQRSMKPASPMPKPSSSFRINGDKAAQTVARSVKTNPLPKVKSTSPAPVKKKASTVIIATTFPQVKLSSDHEAVIAIERPVQEQSRNDPKKVFEALNELKNVEESKFISSLFDEENHIEEQKDGEPQVFDEVLKEPVVFKEVPKQVGVVVVATAAEKMDEGKKVEDVEEVERRVESDVRKSRLGAAVTTVVTATPATKKMDAPRSNDVIEETKSKLMGTRKNRVLALVGAFETVISLQEPEGQQNQKAHQVQQGQQEQSFENKKIQQDVENRQKQEVQEGQNAQQLERGDEVHQDQPSQMNGEHQEKGKEEENTMLKEMVNETQERGQEGEDEMLKEEEADEALEIGEKGEDALKEEEADEALESGEKGEVALVKEEEANEALQTSSTAKEESTESMQEKKSHCCQR